MNIKTYIAAAVIALTAACSEKAPTPTPIDPAAAAENPADRDHSGPREASNPNK